MGSDAECDRKAAEERINDADFSVEGGGMKWIKSQLSYL